MHHPSMVRRAMGAWLVMAALFISTAATARADGVEAILRQLIERTRVVPLNLEGGTDGSWALFSPGKTKFLVLASNGELASNTTGFELLLFDVADVERAAARSRPAAPRSIARFASAGNADAIRQVVWLDEERVAFVGERPGEPAQVYEVEVATGRVRALSAHPTSVVSFSLASKGDGLVYAAEVEPDDPVYAMDRDYLVVTDQSPNELITGRRRFLEPPTAYFLQRRGQPAVRLDVPVQVSLRPPQIEISPTGALAVLTVIPPRVPEAWAIYDRSVRDRETIGLVPGLPTPPWAARRVLLDTRTGVIKELLGTPSSARTGSTTTLWDEPRGRVLLTNTYLPPNVAPGHDILRPATVDYDLASGAVHVIASHDPADGRQRVLNAALLQGDQLSIRTPAGERRYRRTGDRWLDVQGSSPSKPASELPLAVRKVEDYRTPPELVAVTARGSVRLLALGDELRRVPLGRAELFDWSDASGRRWKGTLLLPPTERKGQLPLVIQTHGHDPGEFLVDGPQGAAAAFAAQAFANAGFAVLQIGERRDAFHRPEEAAIHAAGYVAAVDALAARGVVDSARVGLIGWSRTGFYVQEAITSFPDRFAAAIVADASSRGYFNYLLFQNYTSIITSDFEVMNGGVPVGQGLAEWVKRDPVFNVERIRTPLKIELYQDEGLAWWDSFVLLRKLGSPVEFVRMAKSAHAPVRPADRLRSQLGAVDWMRYWILGERRADADAQEQYRRWDILRTGAERVGRTGGLVR